MTDEPNAHERERDKWVNVALVIGFNELAHRSETLGERIYFRMARNACEALLDFPIIQKEESHTMEIRVPCRPSIQFRAEDIEMMRATVAEFDLSNAKGRRVKP